LNCALSSITKRSSRRPMDPVTSCTSRTAPASSRRYSPWLQPRCRSRYLRARAVPLHAAATNRPASDKD
jgi:hypothetical protein